MSIPIKLRPAFIEFTLGIPNTNDTPSVTLVFAKYPFPQNTPTPVVECGVTERNTGAPPLVSGFSFTDKTVTINFFPDQSGNADVIVQMGYQV